MDLVKSLNFSVSSLLKERDTVGDQCFLALVAFKNYPWTFKTNTQVLPQPAKMVFRIVALYWYSLKLQGPGVAKKTVDKMIKDSTVAFNLNVLIYENFILKYCIYITSSLFSLQLLLCLPPTPEIMASSIIIIKYL